MWVLLALRAVSGCPRGRECLCAERVSPFHRRTAEAWEGWERPKDLEQPGNWVVNEEPRGSVWGGSCAHPRAGPVRHPWPGQLWLEEKFPGGVVGFCCLFKRQREESWVPSTDSLPNAYSSPGWDGPKPAWKPVGVTSTDPALSVPAASRGVASRTLDCTRPCRQGAQVF